MTGPSSWRNLHDVQSAERSEAWSELLGLRSNPRTTPGPSYTTSLLSSPGYSPSQPTGRRRQPDFFTSLEERDNLTLRREEEEASTSIWMPSPASTKGRKSLDSVFASVPSSKSDKQPPTRPRDGLRALDPFSDAMEATTNQAAQGSKPAGTLFSALDNSANASFQSLEPLFENADGGSRAPVRPDMFPYGLTTRLSLPREQRKKVLGSLSPSTSHPLLCKDSFIRRGLSPVSSHNALASEAMGRASEMLSPDVSEAVIQHESYRRAALDFVLELAGPHLPSPAAKHVALENQLIKPDELPIPAFAIDRDGSVTMWNKQLAGMSGWEGEEMLKGLTSLSSIFQAENKSSTRSKGCLELMRGVLFGMSPPESSRFLLRKRNGVASRGEKWGGLHEGGPGRPPRQTRSRSKSVGEPSAFITSSCVPVELRLSRRSDILHGVTGVLCVVVPIAEAVPQLCDSCRVGATRNVEPASSRKAEAEVPHERTRTPEKTQRSLLDAGGIFEQCPSSTSSSCSGGADSVQPKSIVPTLCISNSPIVYTTPTTFPAVSHKTDVTSEAGPSQVRALVMETVDAVRMELTQNLERCGVEVVSCGSLGEAMWRFERSLCEPQEGPKFDVIFLELESHCPDDLFFAIRDLRRLEVEARIMGEVAPREGGRHAALGTSGAPSRRPEIKDETSLLASSITEAALDSKKPRGSTAGEERGEALDTEREGNCSTEPDSVGVELAVDHEALDGQGATASDAEKRCLILAAVNLNRWDLAGLDVAMEQCVRAGGDAVIPRSMPLQQLKTALRKLGIKSKYLTLPSRLPRALSGNLHNPLNLSR